ncbi:hypothetical protein RIF29_27445 [Crotalaria pallida]|uniref:Uncharacterized protein n=1 Tax=Crotalaria pallida TaxID=3830 RepID=A0AAN9EPS3_CROPI
MSPVSSASMLRVPDLPLFCLPITRICSSNTKMLSHYVKRARDSRGGGACGHQPKPTAPSTPPSHPDPESSSSDAPLPPPPPLVLLPRLPAPDPG